MAQFLMPWVELQATTSEKLANELSDQLVEFGAQAVTFHDAGDDPIFEPNPESPRLWQRTVVTGLFDHEHPMSEAISHLMRLEEEGLIAHFQIHQLADEDWERRCLDSFVPIRCGKRLWICPSWHTPPDPKAVNVILDPGLAFGTGSHQTTGLCLAWLDEHINEDSLVIDYGCGSGILAIAALKLGAKRAIAIDNDPQALIATHDNAERNNISPNQLITQLPDEPIHETADILIANILAQPLIELASKFAALTQFQNKIVLSGILKSQVDVIIGAYDPWFHLESMGYRDDWIILSGFRKKNTSSN